MLSDVFEKCISIKAKVKNMKKRAVMIRWGILMQ